MEIKEITNKEEWENFLLQCAEKTFLQSWNWGGFNKEMGAGKIWRFGAYNQQKLIGVALILNQITDENIRRMWTLQAVRDGVNVAMAEYWLADFKRQSLPGGNLSQTNGEQINLTPPSAIMFRCAIDGKEYDTRMIKSVMIYEGNLSIFNAFVEAFRSVPSAIESSPA